MCEVPCGMYKGRCNKQKCVEACESEDAKGGKCKGYWHAKCMCIKECEGGGGGGEGGEGGGKPPIFPPYPHPPHHGHGPPLPYGEPLHRGSGGSGGGGGDRDAEGHPVGTPAQVDTLEFGKPCGGYSTWSFKFNYQFQIPERVTIKQLFLVSSV
ncbi:hypothetical protein Ancab_039299 [Ancistrocladus abbreviatus]